MALRLHVKGPPRSAQRAAARRGISAKCFSTSKRSGSYCDAPCTAFTKAQRWYGEGGYRTKAPFSEGTLLFFSTKDCSSLRGGLGRARRKRRRRRR